MLGTFTFKRLTPRFTNVHYVGPVATPDLLCTLEKVNGMWVVPGTPVPPSKTRLLAAYGYLQVCVCDPVTRTMEAETRAAWDRTPLQTGPIFLTVEQASTVYDLLVSKCGANERDRAAFVQYCADLTTSCGGEWRFGGLLGFGGKFYVTGFRWYVGGYGGEAAEERYIIAETNQALQQMYARSG